MICRYVRIIACLALQYYPQDCCYIRSVFGIVCWPSVCVCSCSTQFFVQAGDLDGLVSVECIDDQLELAESSFVTTLRLSEEACLLPWLYLYDARNLRKSKIQPLVSSADFLQWSVKDPRYTAKARDVRANECLLRWTAGMASSHVNKARAKKGLMKGNDGRSSCSTSVDIECVKPSSRHDSDLSDKRESGAIYPPELIDQTHASDIACRSRELAFLKVAATHMCTVQ